ncbi:MULTISPECIES: hypothetical protein [Pseudoalteromonas]|uniref:Uncharacterized protein n=1 Tax=Pseudoalteromonas amylolytica TaxID=1859457 RepID=A0A1S1MU31_9GAMM|nr:MULTISPECIES: hypothetical protein [Pseudoalteromonas]MCF6436941.1 hypothetical protein [Pseudoalteromonas sp. MMG022]OHU85058.1 hypothetical protein BFC16_20490 [Pseudoalteromonas sp. JW3]OHU89990.1 hypothetical protein BET10_14485 [Pseudoalteromonas amylolytica]
MKKLLLTTIFGLISSASFSSLATPDLASGYYTTQEVLEFGRKYQVVKEQLNNSGYELQGCEQQPVYYFAQPSEDVYLFSQAECYYSIPKDPNVYSFRTDYATVVVDIYYHQLNYLYHEGDVNVSYFTAY